MVGPKHNHIYLYKMEAEGDLKSTQRRRQCEDKSQRLAQAKEFWHSVEPGRGKQQIFP